ncbi:hypothetical protein [Streptomyces longispororuber]|uniref:hypothetical protein n=1 Tax=Streptomyces longispororuber TaxID=68230 RepID=UPI00210AE640|nr:hypothetical protein [Streptomyces longispororuber]MCQ4213353.1 hypothetical protein [Streptomyces longispororuber]
MAGVVMRIPSSWRTRLGLLATSFLAAIGVLPILVDNPEPSPATRSSVERINADYLAALIRKGPFTETLPPWVQAAGFGDVQLNDASPRVDAVALKLKWAPPPPSPYSDPGEGFSDPLAHFEIYNSPEDANHRATTRISQVKELYKERGPVYGNRKSFMIFGNGETIAGGARGYVYVEAYGIPDANAYVPTATGTVNAMLNYAHKMEKIAAEDG